MSKKIQTKCSSVINPITITLKNPNKSYIQTIMSKNKKFKHFIRFDFATIIFKNFFTIHKLSDDMCLNMENQSIFLTFLIFLYKYQDNRKMHPVDYRSKVD